MKLIRTVALACVLCVAGCAATGPQSTDPASAGPPTTVPAAARAAPTVVTAGDCKAEIQLLKAQLAAETAERQKLARAAKGREDALRRQLEAMKSIERGILDRDEKLRTEMR